VLGLLSLLSLAGTAAAAQVPAEAPQGPTAPAAAGAPAGQEATYAVDIRRLPSAPVIDGKLDDPVWQQAAVLGDFTQSNPDEGKPPTQRTEVRLGYDAQNLYFGIRCYDTEPDKIIAPVMQRDGDLTTDDSIWIVLDTFHDRRNGFLFVTNPRGAMVDGQVRNEGQDTPYDWDGIWQVATTRDAQGWTAEIAIPFKTLRYSPKSPAWGFNVWRYLARRREESAWRPIRQEWGRLARFKVSQYGEIRGLGDLEPGGRYSFIPYALGRSRDQDRFGSSGSGTSTQGQFGGDLKVSITPELVGDLTVRTDFAEAEADQEAINLTRYKIDYPEKRQFFLEGANLFYFGDRITPFDPPQPFRLFNSRQIGLAENGRVEVPVLGGGKVSGRVGETSVGLLNMTTERTSFIDDAGRRAVEPRTNFTVVRLKQDIAPGATVGVIGLNKDQSNGHTNRSVGADWDLALGSRLSTEGFFAKTYTPGLRGDDGAWSADLIYQGPYVRLGETYKDFGNNFNPEMGFITLTGIKRSLTELSAIVTPDRGLMHRVFFVNSFDHITDQSGNVITQLGSFEVGSTARNEAGLATIIYDDTENLYAPLEISKGIFLPAGHYRFHHLFIGFASDYTRRVGCTLWYDNGEFYDGHRLRTVINLVLKPVDGMLVTGSWERNDVTLREGDFISDLAKASVDYNLTPRLLARMTLQWNKEDNYRGNFLIDWAYRPGSHVYLVYNDIRDLDRLRRETGFSPVEPGRSFALKLSQRFDF
jgi:hypothetical protein